MLRFAQHDNPEWLYHPFQLRETSRGERYQWPPARNVYSAGKLNLIPARKFRCNDGNPNDSSYFWFRKLFSRPYSSTPLGSRYPKPVLARTKSFFGKNAPTDPRF